MNKKIELVELNANARYWLVRADGGRYYDHFKYHNFISVHHNEMTLEKLQTSTLLLTREKTLDHYKRQIAETHKNDNWSKHQVTFAAKRLYNFIEEMEVGDFVIVPSYKSNYFLIGQINSGVKEITPKTNLTLNHGFDMTSDFKRRKVKWINEVPRRKINPKFLYSTLTMHHSIMEVTKHAQYIDGLISPLYLKNGKLHLKLNVNTQKSITAQMWRSLYSVIDTFRNEEVGEEITATANVESPGDITLASAVQFISDNKELLKYGIISLAILFGDVDITVARFKGVVPTILDIQHRRQETRKIKLENDSSSIDLSQKEKDVTLHDIERQIKIKEAEKRLEQISRIDSHQIRDFDITIDPPHVSYANEDQMQMDSGESMDEG
ncbi:TPA: hypothetical protein U1C30_000670 [Streptococcus suis]|nr:hypothetical protein [Streptococcus suis]HEM3643821.1 hypothetical protein [Streptococcus suis]